MTDNVIFSYLLIGPLKMFASLVFANFNLSKANMPILMSHTVAWALKVNKDP